MTVTVSANGQTAFLVQLLLLESVRCAMKYQIFVFLMKGHGKHFRIALFTDQAVLLILQILHRKGRDFPCSQMILI